MVRIRTYGLGRETEHTLLKPAHYPGAKSYLSRRDVTRSR